MATQNLFKWRHFLPDVIMLNVRWYCRESLSYRNLQEMMVERGVEVVHTTIFPGYRVMLQGWVNGFSHLSSTNDSWKTDETYKIEGKWRYLYRAIDSEGNTLDFMLSAKRYAKAAKRFFDKVLRGSHFIPPRVINVDKNAAYPPAIVDLKKAKTLPKKTELRQKNI